MQPMLTASAVASSSSALMEGSASSSLSSAKALLLALLCTLHPSKNELPSPARVLFLTARAASIGQQQAASGMSRVSFFAGSMTLCPAWTIAS